MPTDPATFARLLLKYCHSENLLSQTLSAISACIRGLPLEFESAGIQDTRICEELKILFEQNSDFSDWPSLYEHLLNGLDKKLFGRFYTPADVCSLLSKLSLYTPAGELKVPSSIYDPTVGAGNLISGVLDSLNSLNQPLPLPYGTDISETALSLFKSNLSIKYQIDPMVELADFLISEPLLDSVDLTLINPPFSYKWTPFESPWFPWGLAPKKASDWAFYSKILKLSKSRSIWITACGIWSRMGAEAIVRKNILKEGWLQAIIKLPANLFYNTSINVTVAIFDKTNYHSEIQVIEAEKQFSKGLGRNKLSDEDIENILAHYFVKPSKSDSSNNCFSYKVSLSEVLESKNAEIFIFRPHEKSSDRLDPEEALSLVRAGQKAFWIKAWYYAELDRDFCEAFGFDFDSVFKEALLEFEEWRLQKESERPRKIPFTTHLKFLS